jgi:hypothetical protein
MFSVSQQARFRTRPMRCRLCGHFLLKRREVGSVFLLQRFGLVPRRPHPDVPFLIGGQDHRHGLGMDRPDDRIRRRRQEAIDVVRTRMSFDFAPRSPLNSSAARASFRANQTTSFFLISRNDGKRDNSVFRQSVCRNHDLCTKSLTHIKRPFMLCINQVRNGGTIWRFMDTRALARMASL